MTCASSGSADAVRMLIARGADVNAKEPSQNQTALMWAAAGTSPGRGSHADRGRRRSSGPHEKGIHRAALRRARGRPRERAAVAGRGREREHPVAAGDLRRRDEESPARGRSASGAARRRRPRGPAYQATLSAGSTPLLVATVRGHVPLALFLLEQGADPNVGRCRLYAPALGVGHLGRRHLESGLRFQRSDERDPEPTGQAAAREGAAGSRRESERAHDAAAAGIRRRLRGRGGRDAVPARQRRRGCRDDAAAAGRRRRSDSWSPTPRRRR